MQAKGDETIVKIEARTEKPHYLGHRKRLRERLLSTKEPHFSDYELLEMLLFAGKPMGDTKPLARTLLNKFGDLSDVLNATPQELGQIEGMGESSVAALKVVKQACFRLLHAEVKEKPVLQSWKALLDYCRITMGSNKSEQFRIFFLDHKNKLIADELQQEGTIDHTPVYPREVVKRALELGAASIILAHNHPSGDPEPSKADISMTRQIQTAASAIGITLHDHLIITQNKHYSFKSNGLV